MGGPLLWKNIAYGSKYIAVSHHLEHGATPHGELVSPGTCGRKLTCECCCEPEPEPEPEGPSQRDRETFPSVATPVRKTRWR